MENEDILDLEPRAKMAGFKTFGLGDKSQDCRIQDFLAIQNIL
jgi:hypothetical protein